MDFSGKLAKIDNDDLRRLLRRLFGPMIPIEAVNAIFNADPDKTLGEVRAEIEVMAAEWNPALSQLNRMRRLRLGITTMIDGAERKYNEMRTPADRALLMQPFLDAVDVLEAAHDDLQATLAEEEY